MSALEAAKKIVGMQVRGDPHYSYTHADAHAVASALIKACEALEPSADTKAAYIGEFKFQYRCGDQEGNEYTMHVTVPWTTIKEIMAAIRARAALSCSAPPENA